MLMLAGPVLAQSTETLATPIGDHTGEDVHAEAHKRKYAIPDLPPLKPPSAEKQARFFNIRPSLALLGDWTNFSQNAANIGQVGEQEDEFQVRSARLSLLGSIGHSYKVSFQVGGEYKGFDTEPEQTWQLTDLSLTFPIGDRTKLAVGKIKETFSYEMVGDAANLPHSERVLNPFFVSRNFGARMTHVFGKDKRATFSFGAFNDGWDINSTTSRGWDLTARGTALVWDDPANKRFLHLGLAYRHVASDGVLRYKGRAETNVGDNFIDTGNIAADSADHFGFEGLLNIGPASLLGEYVTATVNSPIGDSPNFTGYYLTGSFVLTGETRPYDRNVGYARRVIPTGFWGAPELVARFAHVDLDDRNVTGGSYDRLSFGLNWWATTRWKFGVSYGHTWLDRFNTSGESSTVLTRVQWVY
ncbi:MAG: OprO/OprP family phosphate-selective porin [Polymorphobacter sp.]